METHWAVAANNRVDSFYETWERAQERAKLLAQTSGPVTILEMRPVMRITAIRGEWTYREEEIK